MCRDLTCTFQNKWIVADWLFFTECHNLCSVGELSLAIVSILNCSYDDFIVVLGVQCSSWVSMNAGTSQRDWLVPMGNEAHESVRASNLMVSRCRAMNQCYRLSFSLSPSVSLSLAFLFWPHSLSLSLCLSLSLSLSLSVSLFLSVYLSLYLNWKLKAGGVFL